MLNLLSISKVAIEWIVSVAVVLAAIGIGITVYFIVGKHRSKVSVKGKNAQEVTFKSLTYLTKVSMLTAIAVVLLYIEFPLLPAVPHLKLNVSDVPTLLASFMFGPITGIVVNAVKIGVCLLLRGTSTGFVGDLSNFISGTLYAGLAGLIYLIRRGKIGAVISLVVSSIAFCIAMWFCNQYMLLPMFGIKDMDVMMPMLWWTLLFNVIKTVLTCALTYFIYKPLSRIMHWEIGARKKAAVVAGNAEQSSDQNADTAEQSLVADTDTQEQHDVSADTKE
ncbi:MAG: ECF transporter S component [Clostridiales bacterium]|nr:ECF transporter S component [Clostridiales bacterium]